MKILAISGSLRAQSSNTAILRAARALGVPGVEIEVFDGLGNLPHFNPDFDEVGVPEVVVEFRALVTSAGALLFSSPEYAHGLPGTLKNALDWLVGDIHFSGTPVALIGLEGRAEYAQASLLEVLRTMSAEIVDEACVSLPHRVRALDEKALIADAEVAALLRGAVIALAARAKARETEGPE